LVCCSCSRARGQRLAQVPVEPHLPIFLEATPSPGENPCFFLSFEGFFSQRAAAGRWLETELCSMVIFLLSSALPARAKPAGEMSFSTRCDCANVPVTGHGKDGPACPWVLWVGWGEALSPRPHRTERNAEGRGHRVPDVLPGWWCQRKSPWGTMRAGAWGDEVVVDEEDRDGAQTSVMA